MRKDYEEGYVSERYFQGENISKKVQPLLANLLEKEEEILVYKDRLKELETAFYYNLEIIAERDLELSVLEKRLTLEGDRMREIQREKDELENALRDIDEKNIRKIHQLETMLGHREREIRALQEENVRNVTALRQISADAREQDRKRMLQLSTKFDSDKKKLTESHREEMEERDRYYLLEIDKLTGKLEEVGEPLAMHSMRQNGRKFSRKLGADERRDRYKTKRVEEENAYLKHRIANLEKFYREMENAHLKESNSFRKFQTKAKVDGEVQCRMNAKVADKTIQAEPDKANAETQLCQPANDSEECCRKKLSFLKEQNEVLKCVIKDLKKNRGSSSGTTAGPAPPPPPPTPNKICSDCKAAKLEIKAVDEKFEGKIDDLKRILLEEKNQRAEEELVLQGLETSLNCLKEKMLSACKEPVPDACKRNGAVLTESFVVNLEANLGRKIDLLISETHQERKAMQEKLEQLKKDCLDKLEEALLKPQNESLLERIRVEMARLETKIEGDVTRNNSSTTDKYGKNKRANWSRENFLLPDVGYFDSLAPNHPPYESRFYKRNDISLNTCLKVSKVDENVPGRGHYVNRKPQGKCNLVTKYANEFSRGS